MNVKHGENRGGGGQVVDRIRHLISHVCMINPAEISKNARLLAFGIDSIRIIELMMCIEEEFQIHLEAGELTEIETVGQLADYIEGLCGFDLLG